MTYPTSPAFSAVNLESRVSNVSSTTRSGRTQVRSIGSQQWAFTARYRMLTRAAFGPVFAFVVSQKGQLGTFDIIAPVISSTSGNATGSLLVNSVGGYSTGTTSIAVNGITGSLKAGDLIKFSNHTKVYILTADRAGSGLMSIEPPLAAAVADNEAITYNDVPMRVRLERDVQQYSLGSFEQYEYEVDVVESL